MSRSVVVALLALAACAKQSSGSAGGSGQPPWAGATRGATAPGAPQVATGASCAQTLVCYGECSPSTEECLLACEGRASTTDSAAARAVLLCGVTNNCTDGDCATEHCAAEIGACTTTPSGTVATAPAPAPAPAPEGAPATDSILPSMLGSWVSSNYSFTFASDGTVTRSSGTYSPGCASTVTASGPVRQEGDVLIMDLGPSTARNCNTVVEGTPAVTVRYRIDWYDNQYDNDPDPQLRLRDIDCTTGDLYCMELMTRR